jgi:hypothetical protein
MCPSDVESSRWGSRSRNEGRKRTAKRRRVSERGPYASRSTIPSVSRPACTPPQQMGRAKKNAPPKPSKSWRVTLDDPQQMGRAKKNAPRGAARERLGRWAISAVSELGRRAGRTPPAALMKETLPPMLMREVRANSPGDDERVCWAWANSSSDVDERVCRTQAGRREAHGVPVCRTAITTRHKRLI